MSSGKLTKTFKEDFIGIVSKKEREKWTQTEAYSRAKDIEAFFQARVDAIQEAQIPLQFREETAKFYTTDMRSCAVCITVDENNRYPIVTYWGNNCYSFEISYCYVYSLSDRNGDFTSTCLASANAIRKYIDGIYIHEDGTREKIKEFGPLLNEWYKIMDTMHCEIKLVQAAWNTILKSCNTINQLLDANPDAKDYLPSGIAADNKLVSDEQLEKAKNILKANKG